MIAPFAPLRVFFLSALALIACAGFLLPHTVRAGLPAGQARELAQLQSARDFVQKSAETAISETYKPTNIRIVVGNVIKIILSFLGIIFVLLVLYGGMLWMTAAGNADQVDKAKTVITRALIGLGIIVISYSITTFVFKNIGEATGTQFDVETPAGGP